MLESYSVYITIITTMLIISTKSTPLITYTQYKYNDKSLLINFKWYFKWIITTIFITTTRCPPLSTFTQYKYNDKSILINFKWFFKWVTTIIDKFQMIIHMNYDQVSTLEYKKNQLLLSLARFSLNSFFHFCSNHKKDKDIFK